MFCVNKDKSVEERAAVLCARDYECKARPNEDISIQHVAVVTPGNMSARIPTLTRCFLVHTASLYLSKLAGVL